jgi:hypothetical protein
MVGSLNKDNSDGGSSAAAPKSPIMIKNFLNLFSGRFIGDLGTFLLFVVLSRKFGEEGIGQYSFATVVGGLALIFADFGLRSYTLKEVGRHRQAAKDRYSEIVATTLTNTAIVLACFILVVLIAPITGEAKWILALIGVSQLFLGILGCFGVLFIAHERMDIGAFYETRASWLVALSAVTVALSGGNLIAVCATIAVAYLVAAIVGATFAIRHFQISLGHFSLKIYRLRLLEALPFALRQILRQVSMRMDILFIGFLLGASQVGAYAVAYRLIYMLFLMFNLVGIAILPASSRNFKESREDFVFLAQRAMGDRKTYAIAHCRMFGERRLHLLGGDLLPAAVNHFADAVNDLEIAVFIEPAEVAGPVPTVDTWCGSLCRAILIAGEHVWPADHDLTLFSSRQAAAGLVEDGYLVAKRQARGSGLTVAGRWWISANQSRFCPAVALEADRAKGRLQPLHQPGRQTIGC